MQALRFTTWPNGFEGVSDVWSYPVFVDSATNQVRHFHGEPMHWALRLALLAKGTDDSHRLGNGADGPPANPARRCKATEMIEPTIPTTDQPAASTDAPGTLRHQLVSQAVGDWKKDLIDLGGRNNLLHYRDLKAGTLNLSLVLDRDNRERLLSGRRLGLSQLFVAPEKLKDAAKRARNLKGKATENDEERGLKTLHLAAGFATWDSDRSSAPPNAPILLFPATLTPAGLLSDDFQIQLDPNAEVNPTLIHLLETVFRVRPDLEELLDSSQDLSAVSRCQKVADALAQACKQIPNFRIDDSLVIGNFSYAKLPMVRDLEQALEEIVNHPLLAAIAGDPDSRLEIRERHSTDGHDFPLVPPPPDEFLVLDADSSQAYVIAAAVRGANLVVIGPPGTGKSQTISNLIATYIARGKSVLFVAEKRAAISAVLDRLHKVGLSELILDLHDGATNRRRVAAELARAMTSISNTLAPDTARLHQVLEQKRSQLESYADQLHERASPWFITAFDAQARLLSIPEESRTAIRIRGNDLERLIEADLTEAIGDVERFIESGGRALLSRETPWSDTYAFFEATSSEQVEAIGAELHELAAEVLPRLAQQAHDAAEVTGFGSPNSIPEIGTLTERLANLEKTLDLFTVEIFNLDLDQVSRSLAPAAVGLFGAITAFLSSNYRGSREQLRTCLKADNVSDGTLLRMARIAASLQRAWREAASPARPAAPLGVRERLVTLLKRGELLLPSLSNRAALDFPVQLAELSERVGQLYAERSLLARIPELQRLEHQIRSKKLGPVLDEAIAKRLSGKLAGHAMEHSWLASILDRITVRSPALAAFDGTVHGSLATEYVLADVEHIQTTPSRVKRAWAERAVAARDEFPDQASQVAKQATLQRRHMPVRELFNRAEHVLTAVKPCWVMSPLVVAQVLPPRPCFDVVIFDEASQIPPADAASSLLRGRQAVIAGDPHQLPPTAFFASAVDEDEVEESDVEEAEKLAAARSDALTRNIESILDVMMVLLPPPHGTRLLNWHYRSKDERLITFSNAQESLYDWSLTTFPGAHSGDCIRHVLVPFKPGGFAVTASAPNEVSKVVELILEHAVEHPTESLGVIALGSKHADAITESLRLARPNHPQVEALMDDNRDEPLFVKNLERVQGDERDAIILTVGYGKALDGRMRYQFGPLNQMGGERRLNVAITRARSRMTTVSSFSGTEMEPERLHSVGAQMLRDYLLYAESGGTNLGIRARSKPELNPFERDVLEQLRQRGMSLVPQYGASSYWIDFAAMHPDRPSQPVLAIEADGARYHSSPTARDRDRLRQEHLERLGWRFHRIWSTNWSRFREREIESAYDAYLVAIQPNSEIHNSAVEAVPLAPAEWAETNAFPQRAERPPIRRGLGIADYRHASLKALVNWLKSDGRLYTEEQLITQVMEELGFRRRGPKILAAIRRAIRDEGRE